MKYNPRKIERKWQRYWSKQKLHETPDAVKEGPASAEASVRRGNYMLLTEFPYPSGDLHIGHWWAFAIPDMRARYLRMKGYNVMYPIGFDAFGLPAENAAIERNIHPEDWTKKNISYMSKQFQSMGASFDWSRQVSTIDPEYYKWTQWMFLKFYEKGLAYRAKTKVNWCPKDKTVLANEQAEGGVCDRCGTPVVQKDLEQWMYKITAYADRLVDELNQPAGGLDWPETTKLAQKNWIGRSEGAVIRFKIQDLGFKNKNIEVFTTRPDTIFGATFVVISPELAKTWLDAGWLASQNVRMYIDGSLSKRELERLEQKTKTGVYAGIEAMNPATKEKVPVWVADYVLGSYGTGAIMAVPAYDERDKEFAEKFDLPIGSAPLRDAKEVVKMLQETGMGKPKTQYRLRDWVLSRQRYWGVPIPMIKCTACGYVPISDEELPVKLPKLKDFKPMDDGRSPLAKASKWVNVKCPKCGEKAERETDTMDTFVDSSWYFIRYTDPKNKKTFADEKKMKSWLPVPMYVGGAEHNTMHLLYSRFFIKALYDLKYISFSEPFIGRRNHGVILGPDSQKMSKSRGNVVSPDQQVERYGADTVRMYLAFMAPYEQGGPWDFKGVNGVYRFLHRVWNLVYGHEEREISPAPSSALHHAIKNVGEDIDDLNFNTAVSELMKLLNHFDEFKPSLGSVEIFLKLLAPFAPHLAEELWSRLTSPKATSQSRILNSRSESGRIPKNYKSIHLQPWPEYDEQLLASQDVSVPVQVNGKVRDVLVFPANVTEDEMKKRALESDKIRKHIEDKKIIKILVIPKKMISIVIKG